MSLRKKVQIFSFFFLISGFLLVGVFLVFDNESKLLYQREKEEADLYASMTPGTDYGSVLAASDEAALISFNLNSRFNESVSVEGGLIVQGRTIFGDGIEAPNVVYDVNPGQGISLSGEQQITIENDGVLSLQGQTGAISLVAGTGISIDGTTISLSDSASVDDVTDDVGLLNAFRSVSVSGQNTISANGADTLTFEAGTGIQLITNPSTNVVRFENTGVSGTTAGWQDTGSAVVLSSSSDYVGIGTSVPTHALDVNGNLRIRGRLVDTNQGSGIAGQVLVATTEGFAWGTVESAISGTAFVNGGNAFGVPAVLGTTDAQNLTISTNNTPRIYVTSGGLIGLGTAAGNSYVSLPASTVNRASLSIPEGAQPVSGVLGDVYVESGNLYFHNGSVWEDLTNYWSLNGTDLYYNGGELGIGIASPDEKLEVYDGNIRINTAGTSNLQERKLTWYDNQERWSVGYAPTDSIRALRFKNLGVDALVLDESGKLGVGVSTPARSLDVNGAMRLATVTQPTDPESGDIYNDGSNLYYYDGLTWVELTAGSASSFWNQNGSAIYFNGGNVGVGTNNPSALFSVGSTEAFQVTNDGDTTISGDVILPAMSAGGLLKAIGGTANVALATAGTDYEVPLTVTNGLIRSSNTISFGGTLLQNTQLNINSNTLAFTGGNVGLGTTSPSRLLDVNGVMRLRTSVEPTPALTGDIYSDGSSVFFYDGTGWQDLLGGGGSDLFTDNGPTTYLTSTTDAVALGGINSSSPFYFDASTQLLTLTNTTSGVSFRVNDQSSDTTPFVVDAGGNVGIGTATPARPLTVNGSMRLVTSTEPSSGAAGDIYTDGTSLYFHNGTAFQNLSTGASIWQQNGANIYYTSGYVGSGTNNPLSPLHVEASANTQLRMVDTGTSTAGFMTNASGLYTVTNTGALIFRTGVTAGGDWSTSGSEMMRITATGTGFGQASPQRIFHAGGAIRIDSSAEPSSPASGDIYSSGTSLFFYDGTGWQDLLNGGGASIWTDSGTISYLTQTTDDIAFGGSTGSAPFFFDASAELVTLTNTTAGSSFRVNDQASDTTPFVINAAGLVGIGTTTPETELDINGTFTQRAIAEPSVASASTGRIYFDTSTGKFRVSENGNAYIDLVSGASSSFNFGGNTFGALATLGTNDNFNLAFETNNSVRMTVETTGDVGIGTTNPLYKLDVNGAIRSSSGGFVFPDGSTQLTAVGAGGGYWAANGTAIYNLNAGNVGIGISNPYAKLDVRTTSYADAWVMGGTSAGNYSQLVVGEGTGIPSTGTYAELLRFSNASLTNAGSLIFGNYNRDILLTTNASYRADLSINSSGQVGIGTRSQGAPLTVVSPNNNTTDIVQFYANNLTQGVGISYNEVRAIGSSTDVALHLNPQGSGNVTIYKNGLNFYSGSNAADAQPIFYAFDDYGDTFRPVVQLASGDRADNYFQFYTTEGADNYISMVGADTDINLNLDPKGAGRVRIWENGLDFYSGSNAIDAQPILYAFDDYGDAFRPVVQLASGDLADNYLQLYSTSGADQFIQAVGVDTNLNLNFNPKGAGRVRIWQNGLDFYSGSNAADAQPILYAFDDYGDAFRPVVQLASGDEADNYLQLYSTSGTDQTISAVGVDTNLNLVLGAKGTGNVRININDIEFYDGGDVNTISNLRIYDEYSNSFKQVLQMGVDDNSQNYFYMQGGTAPWMSVEGADTDITMQFIPKGAGNVRVYRNDLEFYDGGDVNTVPNLRVYDEWSNAFREVIQMSVDDNSQNYLGINAGSATQTFSVLGASTNSGFRFNSMGTGNMYINGGAGASSGTGQGTLHIGLNSTTADTTSGITFGVGRTGSGATAQGGIYVTDSSSGTSMRFATSNDYGSGAQTRLTIDPVGNATFTGTGTFNSSLAAPSLNLGSSAQTNGKLQMHGSHTSTSGPHILVTTSADSYPIYQQLNWNHDNVSFNFDSYYDNAWRSSYSGSNYQIYKQGNTFNINYASGVAAGSGVTFQTGLTMNTSGYIGLADTTPSSRFTIGNNVSSGTPDTFAEYQILLYDSGVASSSYGMGVEGSTSWFNSSSDFKWYSGASLANGMYLNNGNLGIGTTSAPSAKLHVVGSQLRWDPSTTTSNSGIVFMSGGDSYAEIRAGQVGNYGAFEPLVLNSSPTGYVGVGTTSPRATLDVGGNSSTATPLARMGPGIAFTSTIDGQAWMGSNGWMWNGSAWTRTASTNAVMWGTGNNAGAFEVWTTDSASGQSTAPANANSRLYVANSGNVGIGTVGPNELLEVNGNLAIANSGILKQTVNSWGDKWHMAGSSIKVGMNQSNTAWQFDIGGVTGLTKYRFNATNSGSINGPIVDFNTSGSSIFYGAVGIGGITPSAQLDVSYTDNNFNSGISITNLSTGTQALSGFNVKDSGSVVRGQFSYVPTNYANSALQDSLIINTVHSNVKLGFVSSSAFASGADIYFQTGSNSSNKRIYIQGSTGNVGIGTSTPGTFRLEVAGAIGPSADNSYALGGTGRRFTEVFATNGTINTSDVRLKENISEIEYGVDDLMKITPVSFTWKGGDSSHSKLGLIAQEVQNIMPEVVHVGTDENNTLGVYYSDLIPVTIKAIQEQQLAINALNKQNSDSVNKDMLLGSLEEGYALLDTKTGEMQKQVDEILAKIDAIDQNNIAISEIPALTERVETVEQKVLALEDLTASLSAKLADRVLGVTTASGSGTIATQEAQVTSLLVSGKTNVNDLGVIGTVQAGNLFINLEGASDSASINTLGVPLKLQSLGEQAIEIMGGKVLISTDGTVTVEGTVETKELKAETITLTESAGSGVIPAGKTEVTISTSAIKETGKVFITDTSGSFVQFAVVEKKAGESFTVRIQNPASEDVTFDWLVVN